MNDTLVAPRRMLGRYEILGEIAQGAMGVVYKARDPLIDRVVAIKTVALGLSDAETEAYERRFFREAKSAGRLNHPNVVTIHDVGRTDDIAYIAMEFLDGQSLRELLDSGVVLPPQRIADIGAEIADGLAFAHENGVVHRDVKPANIMVLASGAVKITDFGIALLPTGTRTIAGNAFGSPRYTSPEQIMGRPVDGRSDIFSLGATVYEMLTGASPFQGGDLNTILKQVLSDPTPPPSSINPRIPRAFDHIVGKALAKDPADRYQTAEELARDLREFDTREFQTAAPAPLPALEHPTTPFHVRDLVPPPADAPLAGDPDATVAAAPALPAWWKRKSTAFAALGVAMVVVALGLASRGGAPETATARPEAASTRDANAGAPGAIQALPTGAPGGSAVAGVVAPPGSGSEPSPAPGDATAARAGRVDSGRVAAVPTIVSPPTSASTTVPTVADARPTAPAPSAPPAAARDPAAASTIAPTAPPPPATIAAAAPADPKPAPSATPAAVPPKPTGRVTFAIAPWGEIYVDGRRRGIAPPLQELRLSAGKHVIEVRNATFPVYRETIDLKADDVARIRHKFQ